MNRIWLVGIALLMNLLPWGCRPATNTPPAPGAAALTPVRLALNWFPEMEHGGFYAAELNGHFKRNGLSVEIIAGGPGTQVMPQVAAGRVEFGIDNADNVILARAQSIPIVAIFAPLQTSPRCIIVHEKSGIRRLEDLRQVTLAMNISNPFAVFLQKTMPLTDVRIVPYSGSVAQFLQDPGFAQQGYLFSEPYLMTRQGGDPHSLLLADAGFNPYTSVVITTEQALTAHPELAQKFVQACAAGWRDYLAAPGPVNAHIHQLNPQMDMQVLDYGAETLRPMAHTSDTTRLGLGAMTPERWQALLEKMEQIGLVKPATVAPAQCFTARFVPGPKP